MAEEFGYFRQPQEIIFLLRDVQVYSVVKRAALVAVHTSTSMYLNLKESLKFYYLSLSYYHAEGA
jgi:hypothetical protein